VSIDDEEAPTLGERPVYSAWIRSSRIVVFCVFATMLVCLAAVTPTWSQEVETKAQETPEPTTVLERHEIGPVWLSGQVNIIFQTHPAFRALYSGDNSLHASAEAATSSVVTLFTGFKVARRTEVLVDIESAGGRGISNALGLAGFTDLDVVRNPELGSAPYLARLVFHQTIPLGTEEIAVEPNPLSLAAMVPVRRVDVRVGKLGTADLFDVNAIGSDSHLQFMNWTVDNNGAYDYAADTRGYTWGAVIEYHDKSWALRFGEMLMPKVANGIVLDWNISRARGENVELEVHPAFVGRQHGTVRVLAYVNHANMGDYREAVRRFQAGIDPAWRRRPDVRARTDCRELLHRACVAWCLRQLRPAARPQSRLQPGPRAGSRFQRAITR
jgi:hypothetical protein